MAHLNKLKPFVPGLAGYGRFPSPFKYQQGSLSCYKAFSGVAAGSVAIFFTSEWIGKNVLQFVPVYNRFQFRHLEFENSLVLPLLPLPRKYTNYKERDM